VGWFLFLAIFPLFSSDDPHRGTDLPTPSLGIFHH
jgi:hypothetical protein